MDKHSCIKVEVWWNWVQSNLNIPCASGGIFKDVNDYLVTPDYAIAVRGQGPEVVNVEVCHVGHYRAYMYLVFLVNIILIVGISERCHRH